MVNIICGVLLLIQTQDSDSIKQAEKNINGEWNVVQDKSGFKFKIPVMFIFPVTGTFSGITGTIDIKNDLLGVQVNLKVDPSTIDTGNEKRDDHLRNEDFFHVDEYPIISFISSTISVQATDNKYAVEGQLTIKDVTKTIQVPITFEGFNDEGEIVFTGSKNINRRTFNIDYSGRGVGDVAELDFTIVASKAK